MKMYVSGSEVKSCVGWSIGGYELSISTSYPSGETAIFKDGVLVKAFPGVDVETVLRAIRFAKRKAKSAA